MHSENVNYICVWPIMLFTSFLNTLYSGKWWVIVSFIFLVMFLLRWAKNIHGIVEISDTFNKKVWFQFKKALSGLSTNLFAQTIMAQALGMSYS